MVGPTKASWARRLLVRAWECLLFGKAIFSSIAEALAVRGKGAGQFEQGQSGNPPN